MRDMVLVCIQCDDPGYPGFPLPAVYVPEYSCLTYCAELYSSLRPGTRIVAWTPGPGARDTCRWEYGPCT